MGNLSTNYCGDTGNDNYQIRQRSPPGIAMGNYRVDAGELNRTSIIHIEPGARRLGRRFGQTRIRLVYLAGKSKRHI